MNMFRLGVLVAFLNEGLLSWVLGRWFGSYCFVTNIEIKEDCVGKHLVMGRPYWTSKAPLWQTMSWWSYRRPQETNRVWLICWWELSRRSQSFLLREGNRMWQGFWVYVHTSPPDLFGNSLDCVSYISLKWFHSRIYNIFPNPHDDDITWADKAGNKSHSSPKKRWLAAIGCWHFSGKSPTTSSSPTPTTKLIQRLATASNV